VLGKHSAGWRCVNWVRLGVTDVPGNGVSDGERSSSTSRSQDRSGVTPKISESATQSCTWRAKPHESVALSAILKSVGTVQTTATSQRPP
jgi:hypothetical protein